MRVPTNGPGREVSDKVGFIIQRIHFSVLLFASHPDLGRRIWRAQCLQHPRFISEIELSIQEIHGCRILSGLADNHHFVFNLYLHHKPAMVFTWRKREDLTRSTFSNTFIHDIHSRSSITWFQNKQLGLAALAAHSVWSFGAASCPHTFHLLHCQREHDDRCRWVLLFEVEHDGYPCEKLVRRSKIFSCGTQNKWWWQQERSIVDWSSGYNTSIALDEIEQGFQKSFE